MSEHCPKCGYDITHIIETFMSEDIIDNTDQSAEIARLREGMESEIYICAAIKTPSGIYRGHRHGDCFRVMQNKQLPRTPEDIQGFVTSRNRFVDRNEGRRLQDAAGIASASPEGYESNTLFSEDLY